MKKFHVSFKLLLDKHDLSKAHIAAQADLTAPGVSKLALGRADCSASALGRIARCFPLKDQLTLIQAWMEDKAEEAGYTPAQLRQALGSSTGINVPEDMRADLEMLIAHAGGTHELRGLLKGLTSLFKPSRLPNFEAAETHESPAVPAPKPVTYGKRKKG